MYRLRAINKLKISNFSSSFACQCPKVVASRGISSNFDGNFRDLKNTRVHNFLRDNEDHAATQNSSKKISEKEFLVQLKDDPNVFGSPSLHEDTSVVVDEDDFKEEEYLQNPPSTRLRTKQYADMIKEFISKRKIKEAIDVLEVKMLKEDRAKPESYIYNLLLGACGTVGYTKKAFSLYNDMKKRGLKPMGGTYTALFNACANCPWKSDGLQKATHLRHIMIEKQYEPNQMNYNAMIKAFGHCGDLNTAFSICDEMISKGFALKDDTLNFLLHACISDQEAGFRHALLVWRKFIDKNIPPSIYSYNLLLRCVRDCELGNIEITKDVIDQILLSNPKLASQHVQIESGQDENGVVPQTTDISAIVENWPNLIAKEPHLGSILSLSEVKTPQDRLLLVGGASGFLENMKQNNVPPDIKTFTQLLDCIPSTLAVEKILLNNMKISGLKPDLDFYNMLIKKRSMRFDYESAKAVLDDIKKSNYRPDLITYGVLALGCKTKEEGISLVQEMKEACYRLNTEILGAMLWQACHHNNFPYIFFLLHTSMNEEIRPNQKFMNTLLEFKKKCKSHINDKDSQIGASRSFRRGFDIFKMELNNFQNKADPIGENEVHPWQQFRQTTETDVRHYKRDLDGKFKPQKKNNKGEVLKKNFTRNHNKQIAVK